MNVIIVTAKVNNTVEFNFLLDTGASDTVLDFNALILSGCETQSLNYQSFIETANGIISSDMVSIDSFEAFGIIKTDYVLQVLDFVA